MKRELKEQLGGVVIDFARVLTKLIPMKRELKETNGLWMYAWS